MNYTNRKIRFYYAHINNMGDALNGLLLSELFNREEDEKPRIYNFDIMGIGSCLDELCYGEGFNDYSQTPIHKLFDRYAGRYVGECYIWGTGFLKEYPFETAKLKRKNVHFCALRGELSRNAVSEILKQDIDIPLADGGILAPLLIKDPIVKKYSVGIIPHFRKQKLPVIQDMQRFYGSDSIIIDLKKDPKSVIKEIGACESVVSSSLHGLIVADAYGIPNMRVKFSNAPLGTGFKYDDYYSAFGLKKPAVEIIANKFPSRSQISSQLQIEASVMDSKKKEMLETMNNILNCI